MIDLEKNLNVIYPRQSMAGDSFQGVDAILCHGEWTSTVTLTSIRFSLTPIPYSISLDQLQQGLILHLLLIVSAHPIGAFALPASTQHRAVNGCVCKALAVGIARDTDLGFYSCRCQLCILSIYSVDLFGFIGMDFVILTCVSWSLTALCVSSTLPHPSNGFLIPNLKKANS